MICVSDFSELPALFQVTGQSHHIVTLLTAKSKYLARSNLRRKGLFGLTVPKDTVYFGRDILAAAA